MVPNPHVEHKFVMLGFLKDEKYISKAKEYPECMYIKVDLATNYPDYIIEKYGSKLPLNNYVIITINYKKIKKLKKIVEANNEVFDDKLKSDIFDYFTNEFFIITGKISFSNKSNSFSLKWINEKYSKISNDEINNNSKYEIIPIINIRYDSKFKNVYLFEHALISGNTLDVIKKWNDIYYKYPRGILLKNNRNRFKNFYCNFGIKEKKSNQFIDSKKNNFIQGLNLSDKDKRNIENKSAYLDGYEYGSLIFVPEKLINNFVTRSHYLKSSTSSNNVHTSNETDDELYKKLGKKFKVTKVNDNKNSQSDKKIIKSNPSTDSYNSMNLKTDLYNKNNLIDEEDKNNNNKIYHKLGTKFDLTNENGHITINGTNIDENKTNNDNKNIINNKIENEITNKKFDDYDNLEDKKSKLKDYILKNKKEKLKEQKEKEFNEWNKKIELERLKKNKLREYRLKQQKNADKGSVNPMANNGIGQKDFINLFYNKVKSLGLHYDKKDLVNFHTSMQCDGMVILSGLSGTGKSQLVRAYASTLGLDKDRLSSRICFIPVRPSWADDSDLLGYADTLNNVYRPGDSELVDTLIDASHNPDKLYIVVFDEMNLAKVEHYFSQFLSVLEMSPNDRYIKLYNESLESRFYNKDKYPANVKVGNNVLFVGTVNTDETTFNFSDKVLDRSNVINLKITPFFEEINSSVPTPVNIDYSELSTNWYRELPDDKSLRKLDSIEKHLLWDIHLALNKNNKNLGIGWRNVIQIESFIQCLPKLSESHEITRADAIDIQLVQRVLTKVRGSEEQLKNLLTADDDNEAELIKVLDKYKSVSEFNESRKVIDQKSQELNVYGFTM